jgi:hypothetical protein
MDEVPKALATLPPEIDRILIPLHASKGNDRRQQLQRLIEERQYRLYNSAAPRVEVVVLNRDMLSPLRFALRQWNPQYFVIDELHKFKHAGSLRSRAAFLIGEKSKFRRGMTGTPAARDYRDVYGQWKVVESSIFGTAIKDFDTRYCVYIPHVPKPVSYQNIEELRAKAFSIATIKFREDCFDIPSEQEIFLDVTLPREARVLYNRIANEHILELKEMQVPMTHTLSRMMQLRQIAIGYARYDTDSERMTEWIHTTKLDATVDAIEEVVAENEKIAIFHSFLPESYALQEALRLRNINAELISGKVPGPKRSEILRRFKEGNLMVTILQEETASESISLAAADYSCFLSYGPSADTHQQASDRTFKAQNTAGTIKLVRIYPRVKNTVELSLYNMLKNKLKLEELLLTGPRADAFAQVVLPG